MRAFLMIAAVLMTGGAHAQSLPFSRTETAALSQKWGFTCREAPHSGMPNLTCKSKTDDVYFVRGPDNALSLLAVILTQGVPNATDPQVAFGYLKDITGHLGIAGAEKKLWDQWQSERDIKAENSCTGLKCPQYDVSIYEKDIRLRLIAGSFDFRVEITPKK
jgi:hypothetical protein